MTEEEKILSRIFIASVDVLAGAEHEPPMKLQQLMIIPFTPPDASPTAHTSCVVCLQGWFFSLDGEELEMNAP